MKKQYGCIVPVSMLALFILILGLLTFPQLAQAQSNRNPCIYLSTSNNNCVPIGSSVTGVGNSPMPVGGLATAAAPTYVQGMMGGLSFDLSGNLRVNSSGGGGGGAATIADGADVAEGATTDSPATTPTTASAATVVALLKSLANSNVASVPAGTAIIGKVGIDQTTPGTTNLVSLSAETTKVIGTVNQGTSPWVISGALTANQSVNVAQINGTTPLMGNGVTGTGSQRVTIASDNTAFSVNAATQGAVNITLTDCSGTIASGATAQNAFTASASRHGFTIANIDTTEPLWISFTTTAAASGTGSYPLAAADATTFANLVSFTSPPGMGINTALSIIAATTSHKYTCTVW